MSRTPQIPVRNSSCCRVSMLMRETYRYSLDRSGKVLKSALIETGSPEVHEWADKSPVLRKAVALYE